MRVNGQELELESIVTYVRLKCSCTCFGKKKHAMLYMLCHAMGWYGWMVLVCYGISMCAIIFVSYARLRFMLFKISIARLYIQLKKSFVTAYHILEFKVRILHFFSFCDIDLETHSTFWSYGGPISVGINLLLIFGAFIGLWYFLGFSFFSFLLYNICLVNKKKQKQKEQNKKHW